MPGEADAVEAALRALRARDVSVHDLERRLEARGFVAADRAAALETLQRTGLLDDERVAHNRARALASRGAGDRLIRHDLRRAGVDAELVEEAIGELEPEDVRAKAVVARRGGGSRTARYLAGKGFSDEIVADVAAGSAGGIG
jgi:SOS response regulatory protein OraA/RecX